MEKTKFLIDQLHGPFRYVFNYIILICPTFGWNKTYNNFAKNDPRFFVLSPDSESDEEIDELLYCCEEVFSAPSSLHDKSTNTLIILDDCAVSKDLKKRSNKFINLAFSGRHKNISVWVLTQQLTSISKPFRDNVACVISFHNPSGIGTKTLFDDYGGDFNPDEKKHMCEILKSEPFSKLCFSLRYPFQKYVSIPSPLNLISH